MLQRTLLAVLILVSAALASGQPQPSAVAPAIPDQDVKPAAPLTDAAFFAALNLELPALAAVREAVDREDWPGARQAYYAYLRDKLSAANHAPQPEPAGVDAFAEEENAASWDVAKILMFLQKSDINADTAVNTMKDLLETQRRLVDQAPQWIGVRRQVLCTNGAAIAAIFHEFKDAPQWFQELQQSLLAGSTEIMPDGSTSSLTPSGTDVYLRWLAVLPDLLTAFKTPFSVDIPPEAAARYTAAIDWQIALRMPDGRPAPLSADRSPFSPVHYANLAMSLFPNLDRPDLLWFATEGRQGVIPLYTSFPVMSASPSYAGVFVMRSSWNSSAVYLAVDFGPLGEGDSANFGGFVLHAYGADFIGAECAALRESEAVSPAVGACNTIAIDGCAQDVSATTRPTLGLPIRGSWTTNDAFDRAEGIYPARRGISWAAPGIRHHRSILFIKPEYFILIDNIQGKGRHRVQSNLQLAAGMTCEVHSAGVAVRSENGTKLHVISADGRSAPAVVQGLTGPAGQGWAAGASGSPLMPSPALIYEETCSFPVWWITVLVPVLAEVEAYPAVGVKAAEEGEQRASMVTIQPPGAAYYDILLINHENPIVTFRKPDLSFVGRLAHLRYMGSLCARIALVDSSAIACTERRNSWSLTFSKGFTGYVVLEPSSGLSSGLVYLDPSAGKSAITVTMTYKKSAPRQIEAVAGAEVPLF